MSFGHTAASCIVSALIGYLVAVFVTPPIGQPIVSSDGVVTDINSQNVSINNEGWRFGNKFKCNSSLVVHTPTDAERRNRMLTKSSLLALAQSFRHCGVCVIERAFEPRLADNIVGQLEKSLEPILKSRSRIRASLKDGMYRRVSLPKIKAGVLDELYFSSGNSIKERNDGRIDIELPWENPYNKAEIVLNPFVIPLLKNLLGHNAFDLKSNHVMYALSSKEGTRDQHWHRDTHLLFHHDHSADPAPLRDVHNKTHGVSEHNPCLNHAL